MTNAAKLMAEYDSCTLIGEEHYTDHRCLIRGCMNPVVASVALRDYARVRRGLGLTSRKWRKGDPALSICSAHMQDERVSVRLGRPLWQKLLFS